jgi:ribosomal protein S18 acetylase RimI-like enzyme
MLIEKAEIQDAGEILKLQKLAFHSEAVFYNDFALPPLTQTLEEMMSDIQNKIVLKITLNSAIIGSVRGYVKDGTGHIGRLIVQPDLQSRGIGTQLMQAIEARLKPCQRYELFTGNRSERSIRLYQRLGYHIFSEVNGHTGLVYMEKHTA